jgi:hypothetical protein
MPTVASLAEFCQAVVDFPAGELAVAVEPAARVAAERSVAESGFLLLGEVHGVRENPLLIAALLREFGLAGLALEWPEGLAPVVSAFLAGGGLADHPLLWADDGRITAGQPRAAPVPAAHRLPSPLPSARSPQRRPRPRTPQRQRSGRAAAPPAAGPPLTGGSGGAAARRGGVAGSPGCAG